MKKQVLTILFLAVFGLALPVLAGAAENSRDDDGAFSFAVPVVAPFKASFAVKGEAGVMEKDERPSCGLSGKLAYDVGHTGRITFTYKNDLGLNLLEGVMPSHHLGINFKAVF